jgi:hypothetical protein
MLAINVCHGVQTVVEQSLEALKIVSKARADTLSCLRLRDRRGSQFHAVSHSREQIQMESLHCNKNMKMRVFKDWVPLKEGSAHFGLRYCGLKHLNTVMIEEDAQVLTDRQVGNFVCPYEHLSKTIAQVGGHNGLT